MARLSRCPVGEEREKLGSVNGGYTRLASSDGGRRCENG